MTALASPSWSVARRRGARGRWSDAIERKLDLEPFRLRRWRFLTAGEVRSQVRPGDLARWPPQRLLADRGRRPTAADHFAAQEALLAPRHQLGPQHRLELVRPDLHPDTGGQPGRHDVR